MAAISPWLLAGDQDTASLAPQVSSLHPEQWEQLVGHAELAALGCSPEKLRFTLHTLLSPAPLLQKQHSQTIVELGGGGDHPCPSPSPTGSQSQEHRRGAALGATLPPVCAAHAPGHRDLVFHGEKTVSADSPAQPSLVHPTGTGTPAAAEPCCSSEGSAWLGRGFPIQMRYSCFCFLSTDRSEFLKISLFLYFYFDRGSSWT